MKSVSFPRRHLATFDNAYAVAIRLKESTGADQYVIRTPNAAQPFRVLPSAPRDKRTLVSLIA
jgi:hypothetical protein